MSVYDSVLSTSKPYLGPAAEQFIARQCQLHLKIDAAALTKTHLPELARWVEVAGMRFMDESKSKELAGRVSRL